MEGTDSDRGDALDRLERLFQEGRRIPPEERAAFLDDACADDAALRRELEELLQADLEAEDSAFLERGVVEWLPDTLPVADDRVGRRVGPYLLLRLLGHGGMGDVYLGVRDQPFVRQTAVKIIRHGMATAEVRQRFEMERQILASLDHPGIARLLDGGVTDDGLPYFAMEFIEGQPITDYCDARRLDVPARLRLFQAVCRAVHYAHQNLVLHRDLKPSNILVTPSGEVRLLDFGIAKLLGPDLSPLDGTLTRTGFRMMTPEYASPEQARGEPLTTASDVYALGVLLYELLTGVRPYRLSRRTTDEILDAVRTQDPERPSTRVTRQDRILRAGEPVRDVLPEEVAAARGTTVAGLQRRLRGDLDNIVLMALRKEVHLRYHSAEQLAEDITRYLSQQPVVARPATAGYRVRKFVSRHRAGVLASVLVLVSLVAGLGTALWQAEVAQRERDRAESARVQAEQALAQSEAVTGFLTSLFEASDPYASGGREITARALLDQGVDRVASLADQPLLQARMLDVFGWVFRGMGRYDRAQQLLEEALAVKQAQPGADPLDVARSMYTLADVLRRRGDYDRAEVHYRRVLDIRRAHLEPDHPDLAYTLHGLALLLMQRGDLEGAEPLFREALAGIDRVFGQESAEWPTYAYNLAELLRRQGRHAEAEPLFRQVLDRQLHLLGPEHPDVGRTRVGLGGLLQGRSGGRRRAVRGGAGDLPDALRRRKPASARDARQPGRPVRGVGAARAGGGVSVCVGACSVADAVKGRHRHHVADGVRGAVAGPGRVRCAGRGWMGAPLPRAATHRLQDAVDGNAPRRFRGGCACLAQHDTHRVPEGVSESLEVRRVHAVADVVAAQGNQAGDQLGEPAEAVHGHL